MVELTVPEVSVSPAGVRGLPAGVALRLVRPRHPDVRPRVERPHSVGLVTPGALLQLSQPTQMLTLIFLYKLTQPTQNISVLPPSNAAYTNNQINPFLS
jgi:hypothetical protein